MAGKRRDLTVKRWSKSPGKTSPKPPPKPRFSHPKSHPIFGLIAIPQEKGSGLYYLQSRYYNPELGRFINADGLISTGQGLLGNNMLAYCNNNPINMADFNGKKAFSVARDLFKRWCTGNGKTEYFDASSKISKALKKSKTMKTIIDAKISDYKKGIDPAEGDNTVHFKASEPDLWLGIRRADFSVTIEEETKTVGHWFWKKEKRRYIAYVTVSDNYNFNVGNESGDGLGSLLNNFGYVLQENGSGQEYHWEVSYVYYTKWD